MNGKKLVISVLVSALATPLASGRGYSDDVGADDSVGGYGAGTLDERVAKLEKRLSGDTMLEVMKRMDRLQGDMIKLRGEMEELDHKLENVQKQQKSMNQDFDRKLSELKASTPAPAQTPSTTETPASTNDPAGGSAAVAPSISADSAESTAVIPPATQASVPEPAPPEDPAETRKRTYQKAFSTLKEGKYPEAVRQFKSFLSSYPTGEYVDTAIYWQGEAYYVMRDFVNAKNAFRRFVNEFSQADKVADAKFKLAMIEHETGQASNAQDQLNEVIKRYPGSNAASQAAKQLGKIKKESH